MCYLSRAIHKAVAPHSLNRFNACQETVRGREVLRNYRGDVTAQWPNRISRADIKCLESRKLDFGRPLLCGHSWSVTCGFHRLPVSPTCSAPVQCLRAQARGWPSVMLSSAAMSCASACKTPQICCRFLHRRIAGKAKVVTSGMTGSGVPAASFVLWA